MEQGGVEEVEEEEVAEDLVIKASMLSLLEAS